MKISPEEGPVFAAWVEDYENKDTIVLRVCHSPEEVPQQERIPVSECGKLAINQYVTVTEETTPDGIVHPHLQLAS